MPASHTLNLNWKNAGASILGTVTITDAVELNADVVVNNGAVDLAQALALDLTRLKSFYLLSNADLTLKTNSPGVNGVQTVSKTGTITAGTFTMTGTRPDTGATATSGALAWNITLAAFQAALDGIFGAGNTLATGGPLPSTPIVVTFQGAAAAYPVVLLTFNNAGLTGGGTFGAVTTTAGVRWGDKKTVRATNPILWWATADHSIPFAANVANLYLSNASGQQATLQIRSVSSS